MLAIRMQRTGRKGHAQFRVVVQESRFTPTSGRVVANIGSYDPHTKVAAVDKVKADFYLTNGAQPSERAARLLQAQGVDLPSWVKLSEQKERKIRNPEKLRSNQPAAPVAVTEPVEEKPADAAEEILETSETSADKATVHTEETKEESSENSEEPVVTDAEQQTSETPADEPKLADDAVEAELKAKPEAK